MRRYLFAVLAAALVGMFVLPVAAGAGAAKVDVCHSEGNGSYHLISVSENAVPAHLAHGDGLPGGPVPGDSDYKFDENCGLVEANNPPRANNQSVNGPGTFGLQLDASDPDNDALENWTLITVSGLGHSLNPATGFLNFKCGAAGGSLTWTVDDEHGLTSNVAILTCTGN